MTESIEAIIALGGNLGDSPLQIRTAIASLDACPENHVRSVSGLYQTAPVGANAGATFTNAAAIVETTLSPFELLAFCQQIENESGRVREIHWGPRTVDLDIIGYDREIIWTDKLIVPHPACWYRRFVIDPLAEIAPDWRHPLRRWSASEMKARLCQRPLTIAFADYPKHEQIAAALQQKFTPQELTITTDSSTATWLLTKSRTAVDPFSRNLLACEELPGTSPNSLFDVIRAGLDEPQRIGQI